jgi:CRISPR-associated protein Cas1
MKQILNTLYVMTQGAYCHLDHDTLKVEIERETKLQVPLHHLGVLVVFGDVLISPALMHRFADDGRMIVLMDGIGRFKCRMSGPTSGNVLLRCAQHQALIDQGKLFLIAKNIVAGKIQNTRQIVLRGAREADNSKDSTTLKNTAIGLSNSLDRLATIQDLDTVRGIEGEAARQYFASFGLMVRENREIFDFKERSRRPPLDPINALLSFLYAILLNDCVAAIEGVGLDPQVGYLHALRPGRPALALDLMEEFRPILADRLALTLVNRRQVGMKDFETHPGGAVYLNEKGRKEVVVAYQKRKQEEVKHQVLEQKIPFGLICHTQARLLARYIRGDTETYIPFLYR